MTASLPTSSEYRAFLTDLKARVRAAQLGAALSVNRELVLLYWSIGRDILDRQHQAGWGSKVIDQLARDLLREFPEMKGFSPRNLKYMRAFRRGLARRVNCASGTCTIDLVPPNRLIGEAQIPRGATGLRPRRLRAWLVASRPGDAD